jgi:mRNA interferase MazF
VGVSTVGAVVIVHFPFSNLSQTKLRPAVVLAEAGHGDWVLCQITSNPYGDARSVEMSPNDFRWGGLRVVSYARPGKLFTANTDLIEHEVGQLDDVIFTQVINAVIALLKGT